MGILLKDCDQPFPKEEERRCATSLESPVDFVVSKIGNKVDVYVTEEENEETKIGNKVDVYVREEENEEAQEYTIGKKTELEKWRWFSICQKKKFAYAVFCCHKINGTKAS
ncbi:BURP domain-containing protein 5-like [Ziziphus jujuba]|uniref:BURP domain-containing protein 5-like n=1 Tax=Ziziphus jujuba TaxID=326968 RepID=A0ABM3I7Q9_ZIZJJ|nr:BURP domain-containing protein 5-like [Ziziphus jujuba]